VNWLLYAPQYHFLMLVLALIAIALLIRINRKVK